MGHPGRIKGGAPCGRLRIATPTTVPASLPPSLVATGDEFADFLPGPKAALDSYFAIHELFGLAYSGMSPMDAI